MHKIRTLFSRNFQNLIVKRTAVIKSKGFNTLDYGDSKLPWISFIRVTIYLDYSHHIQTLI